MSKAEISCTDPWAATFHRARPEFSVIGKQKGGCLERNSQMRDQWRGAEDSEHGVSGVHRSRRNPTTKIIAQMPIVNFARRSQWDDRFNLEA